MNQHQSSKNQQQPPTHRTALGFALAEAQQEGQLVLQHCEQCSAVQYPPREVCRRCLSDRLEWQAVAGEGTLLASNALHSSIEPFFQAGIAWQLASVKLDAGPVLLVCNGIDAQAGDRVAVSGATDSFGNLLLALNNNNEERK